MSYRTIELEASLAIPPLSHKISLTVTVLFEVTVRDKLFYPSIQQIAAGGANITRFIDNETKLELEKHIQEKVIGK